MSIYDIAAYGAMLADVERIGAYRRALAVSLGPDSVVLDLGAGTGIHALIACQLGARRVFAVESVDVIQVAREIARDNGFADRIEFLQDNAARITLPERADVIVSDLRGVLPLFGRHLPTIIDARDRLLAPGGTLIPRSDTLRAAPIEEHELWDRVVGPWQQHGLDMTAARRLATQQLHRARPAPGSLLAPPETWAVLDYRRAESADAGGMVRWAVERRGVAHGFAVWFDATLGTGIELCNAPGDPELIYGAAFLPLPEAVEVEPGASIDLRIDARLIGDDYIWTWEGAIGGADGVLHAFRQSTFHGAPISPLSLRRGDLDHVPRLTVDGRIDLEALSLIDGATPLRDIAQRLFERHPDAFRDAAAARDRIATLARRYGS